MKKTSAGKPRRALLRGLFLALRLLAYRPGRPGADGEGARRSSGSEGRGARELLGGGRLGGSEPALSLLRRRP